MLYTAKCYWPGVDAGEFDRVASAELAAAASSGRGESAYLGSILLPRDELVLCLLESPSRSAVQRITDRAAIPCERIIEAVWLAPPGRRRARLLRPTSRRMR
jgi:hypothetical protein